VTPDRARTIAAFLASAGWDHAERRPLAGDASARRYERLIRPDGAHAILMDSPTPKDDVIPFVAVDVLLRELNLSAPEIFADRADEGLLLLEDFGDGTFTRLLDGGADPHSLYRLAVDALIALHRHFNTSHPATLALPRFDADQFIDQVMLFADIWMPTALGLPAGYPLDPAARTELRDSWRAVIPDAVSAVPASLLLRDYHVDNLIRLPDRADAAACGLLDFQNAGIGPVSYDLVSLLEDARRDVPADLAATLLDHYLAAFPDLDPAAFRRSYAVLGAVRHTRITAVFARLWLRDRRPDYLHFLPRVWRLLEGQLGQPPLAPVRAWFDRHLPADARASLFAAVAAR
jgi:aminoglycoside/choline kinase family phosphotransferase